MLTRAHVPQAALDAFVPPTIFRDCLAGSKGFAVNFPSFGSRACEESQWESPHW